MASKWRLLVTSATLWAASALAQPPAEPEHDNLALGKSYSLSPRPSYPLCTDPGDRTQLTDGVYTRGYFWTQKTTVGWTRARPVIITIDLGKVEPIRGVSYSTAAGVAGVTWPMTMGVLVSDDGTAYHVVGDLVLLSGQRELPPKDRYANHRFWTDALRTHARYVQLVIGPGGPYCFVDEIEVYGGENAWLQQPLPGKPTAGGAEYFRDFAINNAVKVRLQTDLGDIRERVAASTAEGRAPLLRGLDAMKPEIAALPPVDEATFRAVLPLNDLHARMFVVLGEVRRLEGAPPLRPWVSHPLDDLRPLQEPDDAARTEIDVAMMNGEWRSAVVNLTSASAADQKLSLRLEGLPGGSNPPYVSVHEVAWTDTREQRPVAAALPLAEKTSAGWRITVPAGMTRQVWLSIHPQNVPAGRHRGRVVCSANGGAELTVPVTLHILPLRFPARPVLHLGGWDYTDRERMYGVTPENRRALVRHLREHFVDSPWATRAVVPYGEFDDTGKLKTTPDTAAFDRWLELWSDARQYCVFVAVGDHIGGAKIGDPAFRPRVQSWIGFWRDHVLQRGLRPEQLVLLLVDEPHHNAQDRIITAWADAINEVAPEVTLWEDPTYRDPREMTTEMPAAVDVLCPNRIHLLAGGEGFADYYRSQREKGKRLNFYSCSGPMHQLDPYAYVRLQAWTCWQMGADACFFWAFGDTGGGNPWKPYSMSRNNYAPMFLAPDSVTPGKHMEALREGVEDYEYLVMLREAVRRAPAGHPALKSAQRLLVEAPRRVLSAASVSGISWRAPKDRWVAETVRVEILQTLMQLKMTKGKE